MKMNKIKERSKIENVVMWCVFVVFFVYMITLIMPFLFIMLNSFKTNREFFADMVAIPKKFLFKNYIRAFTELSIDGTNLVGMFGNTAYFTVVGTISQLIFSMFASYVVAKYDFKGKKFIYNLAVIIQIIPIVGTSASIYKLYNDLGVRNNLGMVWLLYMGGFGFNFILLYGYFKSISWSYAEAAFLDGAGNFTAFRVVMLPQAMPILTALTITTAIGIWNDYMTPFMYLENYPTVALGIFQFQKLQVYRSNMPIFFCAVIMSAIPVFILFAIFHKTIMENTVAGGLKG